MTCPKTQELQKNLITSLVGLRDIEDIKADWCKPFSVIDKIGFGRKMILFFFMVHD